MLRLTLPLAPPPTLDDLERFTDLARRSGMEHLDVLDGHLVAHDDTATAPAAAPKPTRPAPAAQARPVVNTAKLAELTETEKRKRRTPPEPAGPADPTPITNQIGAKPGTIGHQLLSAVADLGGTFDGSITELAREYGGGNLGADTQMASKLKAVGLLHAPNRRSGPVHLTGEGWRRIDRTPPRTPAQAGIGHLGPDKAPSAAAVPVDFTALGRESTGGFDPDEARSRAADAL